MKLNQNELFTQREGIVLAQMNIEAGNPSVNFATIERLVEEAKKLGASVVVFPELCISGYLIGDLFKDRDFVSFCESYNDMICNLSKKHGVGIVWGNLATEVGKVGQYGDFRLFNAVFAAENGAYMDQAGVFGNFRPKTNLPNYGMFDDKRYFTSYTDVLFEK